MKHFKVFRRDGSEVRKGDTLHDFRNEAWTFQFCTHPRKLFVTWKEDPNGDDYWPNMASRAFYASVFDAGIYDDETQEWTFPLS